MLYSINKHNIAKQLHSKKLIKKKEINGKYGIRSHHFMANRRGKSGSSNIFYSFGLQKITADGDYSHQIKRCLLLRRKAMTNLDRVLKRRDVTFLTNVHIVKATAFPGVMYG